MVKKVNTKNNELKKKTSKVIKKTNVKKVKGGSLESRKFATKFNNLVNLYYLIQMVLNIRKYNVLMTIPDFNKMNEKEKIDNVSEKLKEIILSVSTYRFARKKKDQLNIFAESVKENLINNNNFGISKKESGNVDIDGFLNIRIRYIKDKIIHLIDKGNSYFFNLRYNIFSKNLKNNKKDDEYRIEEDFLSDLFLGDIHFYLRNTSTAATDFTDKESVFVGNRSKYRLKSIDFNKIGDDKTKLRIFYTMIKFTFYEDNLRRLISCPTELRFFMYNDNQVMNLSINKSQLYDVNKTCSENQENDNETIQKYINTNMPIFNSINDEKDFRVNILYNKYLKFIKDTNNAFSIGSFLEFIGYKFSKLPEFTGDGGKEERKEEINEALVKIFGDFINTNLTDINNVSSPNRELTFSELSRELNILHDKIFLLDKLIDSDYYKSYFYKSSNREKFVEEYTKFIMEIYNNFFKDKQECNGEIKEESEKELKKKIKNYITNNTNGEKYQRIFSNSSLINDIRNIKSQEDNIKYFGNLNNELENIIANFNTVKKNNKDKEKIFKLIKKTKNALQKFSNCKNFYKIIIDVDLPTILKEDYDIKMLQMINELVGEEGRPDTDTAEISQIIFENIQNLDSISRIYTNISRIVYYNNSNVRSIPEFFNNDNEFVEFVIKTINIIYSNRLSIESFVLTYLLSLLTYNMKEENINIIKVDPIYNAFAKYNEDNENAAGQDDDFSVASDSRRGSQDSSVVSDSRRRSQGSSVASDSRRRSQGSSVVSDSRQGTQSSSLLPTLSSQDSLDAYDPRLQSQGSSVVSNSRRQPARHRQVAFDDISSQSRANSVSYGSWAYSPQQQFGFQQEHVLPVASNSRQQQRGSTVPSGAFGNFDSQVVQMPPGQGAGQIATGGKDKNKKKLTQKEKEKAKKAKEKAKEKAKKEKAKEKAKKEKAKEKAKKEKAKEKAKKAKEKAKKVTKKK